MVEKKAGIEIIIEIDLEFEAALLDYIERRLLIELAVLFAARRLATQPNPYALGGHAADIRQHRQRLGSPAPRRLRVHRHRSGIFLHVEEGHAIR